MLQSPLASDDSSVVTSLRALTNSSARKVLILASSASRATSLALLLSTRLFIFGRIVSSIVCSLAIAAVKFGGVAATSASACAIVVLSAAVTVGSSKPLNARPSPRTRRAAWRTRPSRRRACAPRR
jgi:hypothetical protein